jgi:tetratricopeptide (TPR) repeat protein
MWPSTTVGLGCQALVLRRLQRFQEAMEFRKREEAIARRLDDPDLLQTNLTNRADLLADLGDYRAAFATHDAADEIAHRIGARDALRISFGKRAELHERLGHKQEALALYRDQQKLARELANRFAEDRALRSQIKLLLAMSDLEGALDAFRQLEVLATYPVEQATEVVNQALVLEEMDCRSEAVSAAQRSIELLTSFEPN